MKRCRRRWRSKLGVPIRRPQNRQYARVLVPSCTSRRHRQRRTLGEEVFCPPMLPALVAVLAILCGIILGYWIRSQSAKAERASFDQRNRESAELLAAARSQLASVQSESAARAGFESLASERAGMIGRLTAERDAARRDLETSHSIARDQAARISKLEADLHNERQNVSEKIALLESAKQALANQFEALAAKVLDQKSKTF